MELGKSGNVFMQKRRELSEMAVEAQLVTIFKIAINKYLDSELKAKTLLQESCMNVESVIIMLHGLCFFYYIF